MLSSPDFLSAALRAFPSSQELLQGAATSVVEGAVTAGWHDTSYDRLVGSVCLVDEPFIDLVGEVLFIEVGGRSVYVFAVGVRPLGNVALSLSRRPFLALGGLYLEEARCTVRIVE